MHLLPASPPAAALMLRNNPLNVSQGRLRQRRRLFCWGRCATEKKGAIGERLPKRSSLQRRTLKTQLGHDQQASPGDPQTQRIPPKDRPTASPVMQVGDGQLHLLRPRGIQSILYHANILSKGLGLNPSSQLVLGPFPGRNALHQRPETHVGGLTSTHGGQTLAQGHGQSLAHARCNSGNTEKKASETVFGSICF